MKCNCAVQSLEHLFFTCPIAQFLRHESSWQLAIQDMGARHIGDWIKCILSQVLHFGIPIEQQMNFICFAIIPMDSLWFTCNKITHDQRVLDLHQLVVRVQKLYEEHQEAWVNSATDLLFVWTKSMPPGPPILWEANAALFAVQRHIFYRRHVEVEVY